MLPLPTYSVVLTQPWRDRREWRAILIGLPEDYSDRAAVAEDVVDLLARDARRMVSGLLYIDPYAFHLLFMSPDRMRLATARITARRRDDGALLSEEQISLSPELKAIASRAPHRRAGAVG